MKKIASFTVNHNRLEKGMYISRIDGDVVTYDIRMKKPNNGDYLGSGELHEREVIHLYADEDWNVTQTPIVGAYPVETYDISSSDDLLADGTKHFLELIHNHEQIEVNINNLDIQLSDIIAGKDVLTNETVSAEITTIVWRVENYGDYQTELFEYKTRVLL